MSTRKGTCRHHNTHTHTHTKEVVTLQLVRTKFDTRWIPERCTTLSLALLMFLSERGTPTPNQKLWQVARYPDVSKAIFISLPSPCCPKHQRPSRSDRVPDLSIFQKFKKVSSSRTPYNTYMHSLLCQDPVAASPSAVCLHADFQIKLVILYMNCLPYTPHGN